MFILPRTSNSLDVNTVFQMRKLRCNETANYLGHIASGWWSQKCSLKRIWWQSPVFSHCAGLSCVSRPPWSWHSSHHLHCLQDLNSGGRGLYWSSLEIPHPELGWADSRLLISVKWTNKWTIEALSLVQVVFRLLLAMNLCLSPAKMDTWKKQKELETWGTRGSAAWSPLTYLWEILRWGKKAQPVPRIPWLLRSLWNGWLWLRGTQDHHAGTRSKGNNTSSQEGS